MVRRVRTTKQDLRHGDSHICLSKTSCRSTPPQRDGLVRVELNVSSGRVPHPQFQQGRGMRRIRRHILFEKFERLCRSQQPVEFYGSQRSPHEAGIFVAGE